MSKIELSNLEIAGNTIEGRNVNTLNDLANFVGKTAMPKRQRSEFWNAYKSAVEHKENAGQTKSVSDLLGVVLTISARTRRIVAPKTSVELDVFKPNGMRAVQLIMGNAK